MRPQFTAGTSIICNKIEGITNEDSKIMIERIAVSSTAVDISHLPSGMVGGVVRPQFLSSASIVASEIQRITNEHDFTAGHTVTGTAVDVRHLPCGTVGRVVCPQFNSVRSIRLEVEDATYECERAGVSARRKCSHLPRATISSCLVDELRCKVNFSIVGPRVVFWTVLEWTWRLVVDRDVDRCSGRTTAVVGPNRIRSRAELHDCWNAPNRTVTRSEVETRRQGGVDGPRGDCT